MRYSCDIVVVDLEASCPVEDEGDNSVERSNIIEIGAVRLDRRSLAITATFSELVRPADYPVTPFITRLTGITPEMVTDRETFAEAGRRFLDWYGERNKAIIAAWGAYYDVPLLRKECLRFSLPFRERIVGGAFDLRAIGMAWLAAHDLRTSGATLEVVLDRMGLGGRFATHRAVEDARAAAAVLQVHHLGRALLD
ncbi:MAG TPA: 3'-5' exonuclease [Candidatus Krumholzibacteria bacterium]|nr:3'-5' exonuclease [Candidatus Krumholzibacteria bacterium]HPD72393.1 3'-5' exonuclease [Candidatus Krumholzibacteria bacterium]HRY40675.1 3'-5' exonuclease [Candidatus Krumholzibacteria bacterium]